MSPVASSTHPQLISHKPTALLCLFSWHCICVSPILPPARNQQALLHCSPQAASSKEHQMGWHCLVSWPNGCLFKHWSCLHCCGSLHVKHSPLKPYANPIKVSAVQRGEAITIKSQACLLSSRKENLIEQLKAKSDSVQHHVEDTRFNCSQAYGGQEEINGRAGESNCTLLRGALSWPVSNAVSCLQRATSSPFVYMPRCAVSFFFLNDMLPISFHPSSILETILLVKVLPLYKVIVISKWKSYTGTAYDRRLMVTKKRSVLQWEIKKSKTQTNDSQYFNRPALYLAKGRKSREKEAVFQSI